MKCLCLLAVIALATAGHAALAAQRPNVIVVFTDDHGYADLSCQGVVEDIQTPHIDSLSTGGIRMASGYVTAPQCVPSRAGLLSGRYQNRFGVESNGESLDGFNKQRTVAQRLKKAGYATGMIGKWHLGPISHITGHGFDDVFAKNSNRPGWANYALDGTDRQGGPERTGLYHLDACSQAARAFIDRHHDRPFLLYLAYRAPHVPLDAPEKYLKRFPGRMPQRRRQALAMISAIDDGVGGVLASLRRYGLEERTLIFLIGDNGAPLKIHKLDAPGGGPGWDGSLNDPLNGEKGMLAEGGIRVPFVAYWKNRFPAGTVYKHPVISLDVAATALSLAGLPPDERLDGVDLAPYLCGDKTGAPHETLFWRWIAQSAVREGKWKYLRGGAREYLFDLSTDREEKHNLLAAQPEVAGRLRSKLTAWSKELQPPGIETKSMSEVWEAYFDYYLDGKPAPKPRRVSGPPPIQGWIARNSRAELAEGALRVRPPAKGRAPRPFIVTAGLSLPPPVTAAVRLRVTKGGPAAFAWREEGQRDFSPKQVAPFDCTASDDWQDHEVQLSAARRVIHIRLLLPAAGADVQRIEFRGAGGKPRKSWSFTAAPSGSPK